MAITKVGAFLCENFNLISKFQRLYVALFTMGLVELCPLFVRGTSSCILYDSAEVSSHRARLAEKILLSCMVDRLIIGENR